MEGIFYTDRGKVRSHNEDAGGLFQNISGQYLGVIADGMGGHKAGDVASEMASTMFRKKWKQLNKLDTPEQAEKWLGNIIQSINTEIYELSQKQQECSGMGTTIVIAIFTEEFITVAHIGDSRCYKIQNSKLTQITEDHSLVNELVRSGEISKQDVQHHPQKNVVLKALGTESDIKADIQSLSWEQEDMVLLCSDGLTDKVSDDTILKYLTSDQPIVTIGKQLIDLANERGGEDNVSLVIMKYVFLEEKGDKEC